MAAILLFIAPWYLGGMHPIVGESYTLGFNNKLGVLGLGFCIALLSAVKTWGFKSSEVTTSLDWLGKNTSFFPPLKKALGEYLVLAACSAVMLFAILAWNRFLVRPYWGEDMACFLGRLDLVALGYKPYQDFQFSYGPAFLYVPLWISRLSFGCLGFEDAYAFAVALFYVLGFCCIFLFLRAIEIPNRRRPFILFLCLVIWMNLSFGMNSVPLRFAIVPASLVLFHRLALAPWWSIPPWLIAVLSSFMCCGFCFLISPEMGIAASVGLLAYSLICQFSHRINTALGILAGLLLLGLFLIISCRNALSGIIAFSSGAYNFPIYPDITNLLLFCSSMLIIPGLLSSAWRSKADDRAKLGAALATAAALLLPVCFGRCDPGHVLFNGLIVFVLMFAATSALRGQAMNIWIGVFVVGFVVIGQISYWYGNLDLIAQAIRNHNYYKAYPALVQQWEKAWELQKSLSPRASKLDWRKTEVFPSSFESITKGKKIWLPFGASPSIERLVSLDLCDQRPQLGTFGSDSTIYLHMPLYIKSPMPVRYARKDDMDSIVVECLDYDLILVPKAIFNAATASLSIPRYKQSISEHLSGLFLYPVNSSVKNYPYFPEVELAQRLIKNCEYVVTIDGKDVLLKPKKSTSQEAK